MEVLRRAVYPVHQLGSRRFDPAQGQPESGSSSEEAVSPAGQTRECESPWIMLREEIGVLRSRGYLCECVDWPWM